MKDEEEDEEAKSLKYKKGRLSSYESVEGSHQGLVAAVQQSRQLQ